MKEYSIGQNTVVAIKVPEESWGYDYSEKYNQIRYWERGLIGDSTGYKDLPPGNWTLLGKASSITEQQAKGLVERSFYMGIGEIYKAYDKPKADWYFTSLESFNSWLTANGIDKDDLILKKE